MSFDVYDGVGIPEKSWQKSSVGFLCLRKYTTSLIYMYRYSFPDPLPLKINSQNGQFSLDLIAQLVERALDRYRKKIEKPYSASLLQITLGMM